MDGNDLGNLRKPHPASQQHFLGQAEVAPYPPDDVVHLGLLSRNLWNEGKEARCWRGSWEPKVQNSPLPL